MAKDGWDKRPIHRSTLKSPSSLKSDLKGMATGKKNDPYESSRNHQSAPLNSLKDPNSFGPPPVHGARRDAPASPSSATRPQQPAGGLGSPVPTPSRRQQHEEQAAAEATKGPPVPYRVDTSGLRTDNLPKPPVRRDGPSPNPPPRGASPASPAVPPRQPQPRQAPPPTLPPRMNEHPDEFTPAPPPTYNEATQAREQEPATLNTGAVNRLGQAGVSVPGFGIGNDANTAPSQAPASPTGHSGQLSELQQRFARMNPGTESQGPPASPAPSNSSAASAAAHKKPPPPPPPKRAGLGSGTGSWPGTGDPADVPPPLPMSSKPRPG